MRRKKNIGIALAARISGQAETNPDGTLADSSSQSHQFGSDTGGELRGVVAPLPSIGRPAEELDFSFLSSLPNIGPALHSGFREWAADKARGTRHNLLGHVKRGFCTYLQDAEATDLSLSELNEVHLNAFVKWLNRPRASDGQPLAPVYRQDVLLALRSVLKGMLTHGQYASDARRLLDEFPMRSFPGAARKTKPTERLSLDHLRSILMAAEAEIRSTAALLMEGEALLRDGAARLGIEATRRTPYRDKALALAELAALSDVPTLELVKAANRHLFHALPLHGGIRAMTKYLFPSPRDLVPFVLLVTISAAYNPDTVLKLAWREIVDDEVFGTRVIRLLGDKGRSGRQVLPISAESVSGVGLGMALDLLRKWTERIRQSADDDWKDRAFLYVARNESSKPKSFGLNDVDATKGSIWSHQLKNFCRDNSIDHFTLRQIRTTVLDEAQLQTGDIMVAKELGRHKDPSTTWSHYTSDGTRLRYTERLGAVFLLRQRWITSNGVIDPQERTESQDKGSATPGFLCFDPYDSPQANQQQGRLCSAYGRCPSCPLSAASLTDTVSVAYYQALRRALISSQSIMSPQVFLHQWREVLDDLDGLLAQVTPHVQKRASNLRFNLPAVG